MFSYALSINGFMLLDIHCCCPGTILYRIYRLPMWCNIPRFSYLSPGTYIYRRILSPSCSPLHILFFHPQRIPARRNGNHSSLRFVMPGPLYRQYLRHKRYPDRRSDQDCFREPGPRDSCIHPGQIRSCDSSHEAGFSRTDAAAD